MKKILKICKSKIFKNGKKWSGDMVDSYLSTKFGVNSLDRFLAENAYYGQATARTDDGRPRHGIGSSADTVKQS